jgi:hypothetical protein
MAIVLMAMLFSLFITPQASAQKVQLPRAKSPLTLLGFESPDATNGWTGMKCAVSKTNISEGSSSLSIFYPKWDGGKDNQWLIASVPWAEGKGFPQNDWSHYGKLSFDAWVDGDQKLDICVELRGNKEGSLFTKELSVKPGEKNTFYISLEDVTDVLESSNIQSFGIYGIRPGRDTVLFIDNVTLLPGDKLPLVTFDLAYPNYRGMIFPENSNLLVKVELQTEDHGISPSDLTLSVTAKGKGGKVSKQAIATGNSLCLPIPVTKLGNGNMTVKAVVTQNKTGQIMATNVWALRKISQTEADSLKTHIDQYNRLIVDGKPFFPIGWYGNTSLDHFEEIAAGPFNTILPYGVNGKSKAFTTRYLNRVQDAGMKLIYCMNDIYPTATFYEKTGWEGIKGNSNIADAVVNTYKSHPAILAWYLNDERPKELMPKFVDYYKQTEKNDPSHPCFIVIYNLSELKYFPSTTDIMGVDRYPIPADPITTITQEMGIARDAVKAHKPIIAVIQTFGWYQYNSALPDRGRIPTEEDLKTGRVPSYEETRNMAYQAIVKGANGLLFYCYYDLRVEPQYKEYWPQLKALGNEIKTISPVLLSPKTLGTANCSPSDLSIETLIKDLDGELFLIAVNTSDKSGKATLDTKQTLPSKISVMFEGRFVLDVKDTKLTDTFKPLEVHVYDLGRASH